MKRVIKGPAGTAKRFDYAEKGTSVACWFLHLPAQSTAWDKYGVHVVTLGDVPGFSTAKKKYPEAEYEIMVVAYDPERKPIAEDPATWTPLTPLNYIHQFHGMTDSQAQQLAELVVTVFLEGRMPIEPAGVIIHLPDGGDAEMPYMIPTAATAMPARDYFRSLVDRTITDVCSGRA